MTSLTHLIQRKLDPLALQAQLDDALLVRSQTYGQEALRPLNQRISHLRKLLAQTRGTHTDEEWQALVAEFEGRCVICWEKAPEGQNPCKGHRVPIFAGGSEAIDNLMPLCRRCTTSKGGSQVDFVAIRREMAGKSGKRAGKNKIEPPAGE